MKWIEFFIQIWASVAMLRFFLQRGGLSYHHSLAQFCASASNWIVKPLRRRILPIKGWDIAIVVAVLLCILLGQIAFAIIGIIMGASAHPLLIAYIASISVLLLTQATAYALILCLVIQMVLSFSAPENPLMRVVNTVIQPLTRPFAFLRRGRWDFSGSLLFIGLWLWTSVLTPTLYQVFLRLLLGG